MNGEVESVQCDYNNGLTDEPCKLISTCLCMNIV